MDYLALTYLHLLTVIPAFFLGTYLLVSRKGTSPHRLLGKIYMGLLMLTAVITLFMSAEVGPTLLGHFGWLHLLSFFVIFTVLEALQAVKAGNITKHRTSMISLYIGGILVAGGFAFTSGRLLHGWLFG